MTFLTKSQIIQKALDGLMKQGSLSNKHGACLYWSNGLACGVGQLIPLELRNIEFDNSENTSVVSMVCSSTDFCNALVVGLIDVYDQSVVNLLDEIQIEHDMSIDIYDFELRMVKLLDIIES
jgi:hypothetical protein